MTAKQINEKMSIGDLDTFIGATLEDMKRMIIEGTRKQFTGAKKLTPAKANDIIYRVAHESHETMSAQVTGFLGDEGEQDAEGKYTNQNSMLVHDLIYGLQESVVKRCRIALGDKKAKANFSLELANAIVEQITEITRAEIDADFDEAMEQMERERVASDKAFKSYMKEERAKMKREQEEHEMEAFGKILTKEERKEKQREFKQAMKEAKVRIKAAKLVREYSPEGKTDWEIFEHLFRETTNAIMEIGEKPQGMWVDVNKAEMSDGRIKAMNQYVHWVAV